MLKATIAHLAVISGLIGFVACGGSPAQPTTPTTGLSQTDVSHISSSLIPATSLALGGIGSAVSTPSVSGTGAINIPINVTSPCGDSGTMTISGGATGTMSSGGGSENVNAQMTFANCRSNGVTLQGNPSLNFAGQFNFANFQLVNPVTFTISGGILFTMNNVTGSATFNCTDTFDPNTFASSTTGSVTFEYPVGQNRMTQSCSAFD